jgi:putative addiction module CopG family antidote
MPEVSSLDQFVERQLKNGKYQSYEAMVQAGLRLLQEREQELDAVADSLRPAVEDFLQGDHGEEIDIEAFLAEERQQSSPRST